MKLAYNANAVQTSAPLESANATIAANAHMLRILSSGLYANKIRAVLREIGCNASDAHIMVGTPDRPIEVHLPSKTNPQFWIKDWGPGMPHDFVMHNYQTYGVSTKQNDNDTTGAFGLGSKSPYAYSDQFTVESAHNGEFRRYRSYILPDGMFRTDLIEARPASDDWPHGVRILLPVKIIDIDNFLREASNVYRWFRIPPTFVNAKVELPTPGLQSQHMTMLDTTADWTHQLSWIHMGDVGYPVDVTSITSTQVGGKLSSLAEKILPWSAAIKLPLGTVDIAVSRESLEYTPRTISNVKKAFNEAAKEFAQFLVDRFDIAKLNWATLKDMRELAKKNNEYQGVFRQALKENGVSDLGANMRHAALFWETLPVTPELLDGIHSNVWWYREHTERGGRVSWRRSLIQPHVKSGSSILYTDHTENNAVVVVGNPERIEERLRAALANGTYRQIVHLTPKFVVDDTMTKAEKTLARKLARQRTEADAILLATRLLNIPTAQADTLPDTGKKTRAQLLTKTPSVSCSALTIEGGKYSGIRTKQNLRDYDHYQYYAYISASRSRYNYYVQLDPKNHSLYRHAADQAFGTIAEQLALSDDKLTKFEVVLIPEHVINDRKILTRLPHLKPLMPDLEAWFKPYDAELKTLQTRDQITDNYLDNFTSTRLCGSTTHIPHEFNADRFLAHCYFNTDAWKFIANAAPNSKLVTTLTKVANDLRTLAANRTTYKKPTLASGLGILRNWFTPSTQTAPDTNRNATAQIHDVLKPLQDSRTFVHASGWTNHEIFGVLQSWGLSDIRRQPALTTAILANQLT